MDLTGFLTLLAFVLLASAFASVARRSGTSVSAYWLTGWLLIVLHFLAPTLLQMHILGELSAEITGTLALIWAGNLFMRASVPYREKTSSRLMFFILLGTYTLYSCSLLAGGPGWLLDVSAALLGLAPLALAISTVRSFVHALRWTTVGLQCELAGFLLVFQHHAGNGSDLALNAALFTIYLSCCIHFSVLYRRPTAGAFIAIFGFLTWALVFVVAPIQAAYFPSFHIENSAWNLPKYIVSLGMILLLLEDQIAHCEHLALHDALTDLPNRRLFQDRLANALERARRSRTQAALLIIDLDHFKQINDTLGHHAGDLLLQNVAHIFSSRVRRSDTVARTGGDEFAIILEAPTSREEATSVGGSLLDLLKSQMPLKDQVVSVGASLGLAVFPDDAQEMEALCITADLRMYEHKRERESISKRESRSPSIPPRQLRTGVGLAK